MSDKPPTKRRWRRIPRRRLLAAALCTTVFLVLLNFYEYQAGDPNPDRFFALYFVLLWCPWGILALLFGRPRTWFLIGAAYVAVMSLVAYFIVRVNGHFG